jgi:iron complex outermembrane receptor protein
VEHRAHYGQCNYARVIWNSNLQLTHTKGLLSISTLLKRREQQTTYTLIVPVSKSFGIVNARADLYLWNKRATLLLQADNIFNIKYADFIGAKMPGRWLSAGVSLKL